MTSPTETSPVFALDLTALMARVQNKYHYSASTRDQLEQQYRRFLEHASRNPHTPPETTPALKAIWDEHVLDTQAYHAHCEAIFGSYFHQSPKAEDLEDLPVRVTPSELDLTHVMQRVKEKYDYSARELALAEQHYRYFLELKRLYPDRTVVPTLLIDAVWHEHILLTRRYDRDCRALFGGYMHHKPGGDALDAAFNDTKELFSEHFSVDFDNLSIAADCRSNEHAECTNAENQVQDASACACSSIGLTPWPQSSVSASCRHVPTMADCQGVATHRDATLLTASLSRADCSDIERKTKPINKGRSLSDCAQVGGALTVETNVTGAPIFSSKRPQMGHAFCEIRSECEIGANCQIRAHCQIRAECQ